MVKKVAPAGRGPEKEWPEECVLRKVVSQSCRKTNRLDNNNNTFLERGWNFYLKDTSFVHLSFLIKSMVVLVVVVT